MMTEALTKDGIKYIIARLVERAKESANEVKENPENDFQAGRNMAYYEMLDILKTELEMKDQDLKTFGLDLDLEKMILS